MPWDDMASPTPDQPSKVLPASAGMWTEFLTARGRSKNFLDFVGQDDQFGCPESIGKVDTGSNLLTHENASSTTSVPML